MRYYIASAFCGFGLEHSGHERVTKTVTRGPTKGHPHRVVMIPRLGMWNHIGLDNPGFYWWVNHIYPRIPDPWNVWLSIAGHAWDLDAMCSILRRRQVRLKGVELNLSCPNHEEFVWCHLPQSVYPLSVKLNCDQNLSMKIPHGGVRRVSVNSVPGLGGGLSGGFAKTYNWSWLRIWRHHGYPVAGCSITSESDVKRLEDVGCTEIALGSIMVTNPKLARRLLARSTL